MPEQVCLSWAGVDASVPGCQVELRVSGLYALSDLCQSLSVPGDAHLAECHPLGTAGSKQVPELMQEPTSLWLLVPPC